MASGYGFVVKHGNSSSSGNSMRDHEEFNEEDVWAGREIRESSSKFRRPKEPTSFTALRRIPTASRMIPSANNCSSKSEPIVLQQSAPVNIPDWSKIYRKNLKKGSINGSWVDGDGDGDATHVVDKHYGVHELEGDDDDDDWLPPHEFIAKKLASSQISSFSVCEGAGRTLKGRDLTKVRNAVLTRTGFLQ